MTGEITLRGRVLPIGGLKEKLLAALRGGITTVLIPEENEKDLVEIPANIIKSLKIIPVSHVDEVLAVALTEAGRAKADKVMEDKNRFEKESFACFDEQERAQLLDYLDRLVKHWHELEENEEVPTCRN